MKVGVKYCGGCNPRYDRTSFIDKLKNEVKFDLDIQGASEDNFYDVVLILCGCTSACVNHDNLKGKYGKIVVVSQDNYNKVLDLLNNVNK
ncbi:hypothetical protein [Clostridium brassicae]|uniref:DUF1450 domain-containing protein n=1 Tax=Clostridium brassicae TaxID=2999072 RepID=A0ABT4DDQ1_9CLOT|nr:hypothetical protein [Clostridium brassicae]MCY6959763.1 hypothetical protein [Clostridium brassicae]